MTKVTTEICYRGPTLADGPAIWELVPDSGALDLNSRYQYRTGPFAERTRTHQVTASATGANQ